MTDTEPGEDEWEYFPEGNKMTIKQAIVVMLLFTLIMMFPVGLIVAV